MYKPQDNWWPKVGDNLVVVDLGDISLQPHTRFGDIRMVVSVEPGNNIVELDSCSCDRADGKGCRWSWNGSHRARFQPYIEPVPITPEEIAKAQPLPDLDDVISFLKRT